MNIEEWILSEFQITQARHPLSFADGKNGVVQHPSKMRKKIWNMHKIKGVHLQCVSNHCAKFEYKGMKTVGVTDYTNQRPSTHLDGKNSKSNNRKKWENIYQMCTKWEVHIFNMWTIIMQSLNKRNENFWSYILHKLGTPKVLRTDKRTVRRTDERTDGRMDGVNQLLDLLSLKRRR